MKKVYSSQFTVHSEVAVRLTGVSKRYTLHHEKPTLVERLIKGKHEFFYALQYINLVINKGEKVGIIGPNGSGKTTLLKIIAGITTPTSGTVETNGKIVSLIDLEAGFHPDLTGEQNVYLNGMLLGMSKKEIDNKLNEIISFADIGQFIDTPLFTYSQGMKLRLGFAIAVNANPEILLLDESMTLGDEDFQKKSYQQMQKFFKEGKTIIVISHWLEFIKKNCRRVLEVKEGSIVSDGGIKILSGYIKRG